MTDRNRLYAGAAIGLAAAAGIGFGVARLTQAPAPIPAPTEAAARKGPADALAISAQAVAASQITIAPAEIGELDAAVLASATVEATPDAEAVLTARWRSATASTRRLLPSGRGARPSRICRLGPRILTRQC